jgi:hypothetical protein
MLHQPTQQSDEMDPFQDQQAQPQEAHQQEEAQQHEAQQQEAQQQQQARQHHLAQQQQARPLPTMTVGDLRQQIMSNALVLYPNIVEKHEQKFPDAQIRAEDIFDICVVNFDRRVPTGGVARHWYAKLTYAPGIVDVTREILITGTVALAVEWALYNLFDMVTYLLSNRQRALFTFLEGLHEMYGDECEGATVQYDMIEKAVTYAEKAREKARKSDAEGGDVAPPTEMEE